MAMGPPPKCHFVLAFPSGSPGIPTVGAPRTLGAHNFVCRAQIEMRFEAKLYPSSKTFQQYVIHHLHTKKLGRFPTFNGLRLSFDHNLCFKCPNGSCEPILDIYILRDFQWHKEPFDTMGFEPWNHSLKIRESIEIPIPKVGIHLGVWEFIPSHSFEFPKAWNVIFRLTFGMHPHKPLPWSQAQG